MYGSFKRLAAITIAASALMTGTAQAAPVLFGVSNTGGGGDQSQLFTIDQSTGALTNVGGGIGFGRISAIDFHPTTGILYATGARTGNGPSVLLTFDKTTGIGTEVGLTGIESPPFFSGQRNVAGMSFRHGDGTLYGYVEPLDQIATVNISTGAASLLGFNSVDGSGNGIAFNGADILYHANEFDLSTIDQVTGDSTPLFPLDFSNPFFDADTLFPRVSGLDFRPGDELLFASVINDDGDAFLATIDIMAGDLSFIGNGATSAKLDAIAFMPMAIQVPEPGTLAIIGFGLAALGFTRGFTRRRRAP